MITALFFIAWLISPIVLLPLYFSKRSECSRLVQKNQELSEQLKRLSSGNEGNVPEQSRTAEREVPKPYQNPFSESSRYDMPQYSCNIPPNSVRRNSVQTNTVQSTPPKPEASAFEVRPAKPVPAAPSPRKNVSTINIILILGALLISLSGFIFAVANWGALNTFFKSVVLISFSAVFFAIHSLSERKLKLPQTGRVFYILGSIFLPATVVAAGILKVFGEYFSFTGEGRAAVLAVMFTTVCIPFFKGAHDYKNRFFAAVSFYTFSASAVSLIWQVSPNGSVTALCTAAFALAVTLLEPPAQKLLDRLFGEENVFSAEWNRFSVVNAWALSVVIFIAAENGAVSAAAFGIFSVCFLTKTLTDKSSAAGAVAFAFFITTSMFIGFDPNEFSEVICIIAAAALICGVLSVMRIFPEGLKKALNILGIIAASSVGLFAFIENAVFFVSSETSSPTLVIALLMIFAELLIFALRYKTAYCKATSFGAMLLLSASVFQLVFGDFHLGLYTPFFSYLTVLAYFCTVHFTKLRDRLYVSADDIILAAYAVWCMILQSLGSGDDVNNAVLSLIMLVLGAVAAAVSNHKKFSPVICPALTALTFFGIYEIFELKDISLMSESPLTDALAAVIFLICTIAAVLLFVKKAEGYAKAYRVLTAASVPIFVIVSIGDSTNDFLPLLAVTAYTVLYLFKAAFPKEKYGQVCLLHGMILLTALFVGIRYSEPTYLMCYPAAAAAMIFAVNIIGTTFGSLEKTAKHTEHFLWYTLPALSGILIWIFGEENVVGLLIFGIILGICALLLSVFRRNTMTLIFPLLTGLYVLADSETHVSALIFAVLAAALGRVLFFRKFKDKNYLDVFGISAFLSAIIACTNSPSDNWRWVCILLLALLTANLMRRGQASQINRVILTIAALFLFPLWWTVPFFTVPDLIEVQFNLLPVVVFCVVLRFIWHDALHAVYNFAFIAAIVSLIVLFVSAMASGNNFDSIFIGAVLFIMLAVSFIIKKKRWFVLAVASMVISAVLLSISRLDSVAWLVYLAITGAALIALGVVNELKKQSQKNGDDSKITRFMSDWKW